MAALALAATLAVGETPICNYTATFDHNHSLHKGKDNEYLAIDPGSISPTNHIDAHDNEWSEYYASIGGNYTALLENRTFPTNHDGTDNDMCSYVFMDSGIAGWVPIEAMQFLTEQPDTLGTMVWQSYLPIELGLLQNGVSPYIKLCRHFGSPEMRHTFEGLDPNTTYSLEVVLDNLRNNPNLKAGNDTHFVGFATSTPGSFTCDDCWNVSEKIMVTCTGGTDFAVQANVADNTDPQNGVSETGMCTSDANGKIEVTFDLGFSYYEWTGPKLEALPRGEIDAVRIPGAELPSLSSELWCNYVTGTLFTGDLGDPSAPKVNTENPCTPFGNHTQAGVRLKSMKLAKIVSSDDFQTIQVSNHTSFSIKVSADSDNEECRVFHETTNTRHPQSKDQRKEEIDKVLKALALERYSKGVQATVKVYVEGLKDAFSIASAGSGHPDYFVKVVEDLILTPKGEMSYITVAVAKKQGTLGATCEAFGKSVAAVQSKRTSTNLKVSCDNDMKGCDLKGSNYPLQCTGDYNDIHAAIDEICRGNLDYDTKSSSYCESVSVVDGIVLSLPFVDEGSDSYKIAIAVIPNTDPDPADPTTYVWAAVGSVAGVTAVLVALYVGCSSDKSSTLYTRLGV